MGKLDFTQLKAAMASDWLNALALSHTRMRGLSAFNDQISASVSKYVYIEGRVDLLAELLGLELEETILFHSHEYCYAFAFGGAEFVSYQKERLEKYAGEADKGIPDGQVPADARAVP